MGRRHGHRLRRLLCRALDLHAIPSHFFRFWVWLTTGMVTQEWAAIHRKHHAKCEHEGDPHSPHIFGIKKVTFTTPAGAQDFGLFTLDTAAASR